MAWGTVVRCAWSDKFRVPGVDDLRAGLPEHLRPILDSARTRIAAGDGLVETVAWQGVPWRWTIVYTPDGEDRPLAYLIPDPQRLQVCIPLLKQHVEQLPLKRMKKSIRDGIIFSRSVGGVWWPTWDVPTSGALDEVLDLLDRKLKLSLAPPMPVGA